MQLLAIHKGIYVNFFYCAGDRHGLQHLAIRKRAVFNALHRARDRVGRIRPSERIEIELRLILAHEDAVHITVIWVIRRNMEALKGFTADKRVIHFLHTCWDRDLFQTGAVLKRLIADGFQRAGQLDAFQIHTLPKSAVINIEHALADNRFLHAVPPWANR